MTDHFFKTKEINQSKKISILSGLPIRVRNDNLKALEPYKFVSRGWGWERVCYSVYHIVKIKYCRLANCEIHHVSHYIKGRGRHDLLRVFQPRIGRCGQTKRFSAWVIIPEVVLDVDMASKTVNSTSVLDHCEFIGIGWVLPGGYCM